MPIPKVLHVWMLRRCRVVYGRSGAADEVVEMRFDAAVTRRSMSVEVNRSTPASLRSLTSVLLT